MLRRDGRCRREWRPALPSLIHEGQAVSASDAQRRFLGLSLMQEHCPSLAAYEAAEAEHACGSVAATRQPAIADDASLDT